MKWFTVACLILVAAPAGAISVGMHAAWQTHDMDLFPDSATVPNVNLHDGPAVGVGLGWRAWGVPWAVQLEQILVKDELRRDVGDREIWDLSATAFYLTGEFPLPSGDGSPRWSVGAGVGWLFTAGSSSIDEGEDGSTSVRIEGDGPLLEIFVDAEWPLGQWRLEPRLGWRWAASKDAYGADLATARDVSYTGLVLRFGFWVDLNPL